MTTCLLHIGLLQSDAQAVRQIAETNKEVLQGSFGVTLFGSLKEANGLADLAAQAAVCDTPVMLVSDATAADLEDHQIATLRDHLLQLFEAVDVVAFVRSPEQTLLRKIETALRDGATFDSLTPESLAPRYQAGLATYLAQFRPAGVQIIDMTERTLPDALAMIFPGFTPTIPEQQYSLCAEAIHLLNAYNIAVPAYLAGKRNPDRALGLWHLADALRDMEGQPFSLADCPPSLCPAGADLAANIAWLAQATHNEISYATKSAHPAKGASEEDTLRCLGTHLERLLHQQNEATLQADLFRTLYHLDEQRPEIDDRLKTILNATQNPQVLENAAHHLRAEKRFDLALFAIERCIKVAQKQDLTQIVASAQAGQKHTLQMMRSASAPKGGAM